MRLRLSELTSFLTHPSVDYSSLGTHFGLKFWRVSNCGGCGVIVEMARSAGGLETGRVYECVDLAKHIPWGTGEFSEAAAKIAARRIWQGNITIHHAHAAPRQLDRIARNFSPERLPA